MPIVNVMKEHELKNAYIGEYDFAKYQEVEYIQSSWTQYIDTWYTPTTSTEFNVTYQWVSYIWTFNTVFWCRRDYNDDAYYIWYTQTWDASYYCFWDNRSHPSAVRFWWNGNIFNITYTNNILSNGTDSITVTTNTNPLWSIYIFSWNWAWTSSEYWALKLYSFKLTTGWTDVRDFVPCYRKSDNEIWLYDLVNNQFYTNAGTWTFTKWPDVN